MDKKFWKGMLTGSFSVLLAIVLMVFAGGCSSYFSDSNDGGIFKVEANDQTPEPTVTSAPEDTELLAEKEEFITDYFTGKMELLQYLVDLYYMEDVSVEDMQIGAYKGMMEALGDPYSCYYTAKEYAALMESSSGVYCGIGSYVSQNVTTMILTIVKPFVNGPAYEAGMLPGDIIYKVDDVDVTGMDINSVVAMMKGEEGTKVKIAVIREGFSDPIEMEITRRMVEAPTIEYEMLENKLGYIVISEFDEITVEQFKRAVDTLKKDGMKALVIDLRDNPGGLLDAVVEMLDYMLPKGLIVYTENKYGEKQEFNSTDEDSFDLPLALLVNGNSASASEIFAGAIQDYKIGTIIGTTTFGKGIVQSVYPLSDGTAVKMTMARYYTPNGVCIHGVGIAPDIEIDLPDELKRQVTIEHDEDTQLQEAIKNLTEQLEALK